MFKQVRLLFLGLALLFVAALATPGVIDLNSRELSNAARLARGLPPRAPRFRRFLPGRGTPILDARDPSPSLIPVSGSIKVTRADNGALVGYVANSFVNSATRRYGITTDLSSALKAAFTGGSNPLEIMASNPPDAAHPFFGAVVGPASSDDDLTSGSSNYALLTGTSHTAAGAPPSAAGNSYSGQNSESTIWNYNTGTHELTASWINTDGVPGPTTLYYLPGSNGLLLVGDPGVFNEAFPGGYAVKYTVV